MAAGLVQAEALRPLTNDQDWNQPAQAIETLALPAAQTHAADSFFSPEYLAQVSVQAELQQLSQNFAKQWLSNGLKRSEPYRDFIVDYLENRHMPRDLLWLAMIESEFTVEAVSRSGASGLWQFMKNSVAADMVVDAWRDERFDFWKSTAAAIDKLKTNYEATGDWLFAIAAYNSGLGFVQRLKKQHPTEDFWQMVEKNRFPPETARYVPRFLAVAYMCNHPVRNGLSYSWAPRQDWVRIVAGQSLRLDQLAKAAAMPIDLLRQGNAELRYDVTPPQVRGYHLKVPSNYLSAILGAFSRLEPQTDARIHVVAQGETLYALAKQYGISLEALQDCNNAIQPSALRPGLKLVIPAPAGTGKGS